MAMPVPLEVFDNVVLSWRNIAVPLKTLNERYRLLTTVIALFGGISAG